MANTPHRLIKKSEIAILLIAIAALIALAYMPSLRQSAQSSVEVKFTDASAHGLAIVPASCPSNPHSYGECGSTCSPSVFCQGSNIRTVSASCSVTVTPCPTGWSCSGGACVEPAPPSVVAFTATNPDGTTFQATGHLLAKPSLVRSGSTVQVYWNATSVSSCAVSSDGGDQWAAVSSGTAGQTSRPITHRTTFTLDCTPLIGSSAAHMQESAVVNIAPTFQEQ